VFIDGMSGYVKWDIPQRDYTSANPSVGLDQEFVKNAIREYLKKKRTDAAGRILQGIIRN
jgi:hypothetical protein